MTRARWRYGSAAASGLLYAAAYPPVGQGWLMWVALVPWFTVLLRDRGEGHKGPGYVFGLVSFTTGLWWLAEVHLLFPLALSAVLSLYPLLLAFLFRRIGHLGPARAAALLPCLWVGVDYLREHLLSGFPWLLPGYALASSENLLQAADLGGPHLLTFVLLLPSAAAALFLVQRPRIPWRMAACALLLPVLLTGYGRWRRGTLRETPGPRVLLVQPSFPQSLKREARSSIPATDEIRDIQLALSIMAVKEHTDTDLVVWAETMVPFEARVKEVGRDRPDPGTMRYLHGIVDPVGVVPGGSRRFLGGITLRAEDRRLRNSALLVGPRGAIEGRFDKAHLTPFGEYLPVVEHLPEGARRVIEGWVLRISPFVPPLSPGESRPVPLGIPGGRTVLLGGLICYEAVFPAPSRERVLEGADVLVNLSNYAWYGAGLRDQVLDMTRFRAVETRRPVVVATNDGPTCILDGNGDVRTRLREGVRETLFAEVPLDGRGSIYVRIGDLFAFLAGFAGLAGVVAGRAAARRAAREASRGPTSGRETS